MSREIDIHITIDTDAIRKKYPKQTNPNPNKPQGIEHNLGFMVVAGVADPTKVSHQGTGDLGFAALVGDTVRVQAASASNNFEDAVLLYGLPRYDGQDVFKAFEPKSFVKQGIVPSSETSVLPGKMEDMQFWFLEADVHCKGTERYKVQIGLYTRDDDDKLCLYGYFEWDPSITVSG